MSAREDFAPDAALKIILEIIALHLCVQDKNLHATKCLSDILARIWTVVARYQRNEDFLIA